MSRWRSRGLIAEGCLITRMETRQAAAALSAQIEKTDRDDVRGIVRLLRLGWFRPMHLKSVTARERRLLLSDRKAFQVRLGDLENAVRGLLRGFVNRHTR